MLVSRYHKASLSNSPQIHRVTVKRCASLQKARMFLWTPRLKNGCDGGVYFLCWHQRSE